MIANKSIKVINCIVFLDDLARASLISIEVNIMYQ